MFWFKLCAEEDHCDEAPSCVQEETGGMPSVIVEGEVPSKQEGDEGNQDCEETTNEEYSPPGSKGGGEWLNLHAEDA